jgi:hypothetical protein
MYIEESAGHLTLIAVGEYPGKLTKAYCLKELKQTVETIEKIQQQASEIPGRAEG